MFSWARIESQKETLMRRKLYCTAKNPVAAASCYYCFGMKWLCPWKAITMLPVTILISHIGGTLGRAEKVWVL